MEENIWNSGIVGKIAGGTYIGGSEMRSPSSKLDPYLIQRSGFARRGPLAVNCPSGAEKYWISDPIVAAPPPVFAYVAPSLHQCHQLAGSFEAPLCRAKRRHGCNRRRRRPRLPPEARPDQQLMVPRSYSDVDGLLPDGLPNGRSLTYA
jgi:hypothetical protein